MEALQSSNYVCFLNAINKRFTLNIKTIKAGVAASHSNVRREGGLTRLKLTIMPGMEGTWQLVPHTVSVRAVPESAQHFEQVVDTIKPKQKI